MSLFEVKPYDREVYEKELKDFLPQKILDVHTHDYLKEFFPPKPLAPGEVKRTVTWPSLVAADDSIEDLQETYRLMLPGKDVTALMFSNSGRSQQANDYVADASRRSGFPALYFSAPEESPEEVERQIRGCRWMREHRGLRAQIIWIDRGLTPEGQEAAARLLRDAAGEQLCAAGQAAEYLERLGAFEA